MLTTDCSYRERHSRHRATLYSARALVDDFREARCKSFATPSKAAGPASAASSDLLTFGNHVHPTVSPAFTDKQALGETVSLTSH